MMQKISWQDVPEEQVNPHMTRKIVYGDKIMIARIKFKDGFVVPQHSHKNEQITQVTFWYYAILVWRR